VIFNTVTFSFHVLPRERRFPTQRPKMLPKVGAKEYINMHTPEQTHTVKRLHSEMMVCLSKERLKNMSVPKKFVPISLRGLTNCPDFFAFYRTTLSQAEWDESSGYAVAVRERGKAVGNVGAVVAGKRRLLPEEAV
jgi:hypothetical protein